MTRLALFLTSTFAILSACQDRVRMVEQPNVVFILADDLGFGDLAVTGSALYETPNIDKLARNAFQFSCGYASSRVCSPSRASIITGTNVVKHGITDWIGARSGPDWRKLNRHDRLLPPGYQSHLKQEWTTLPEALKSAGYSTFFAGKWHLGGDDNGPLSHGFDYNKGGWEKGSPIGGYFSPWQNPYLENREKGENLSLRLAKETATFIEENGDTPFFAFLSFYAVHSPIQTTRKKWEKYREKAILHGVQDSGFVMERILPIRTTQDNPIYAGLVDQMDEAIGMVLDKLENLGLADQTIIVFTSDNGGVASGDAYSTSNKPLRGGKGYQWEGGIRVPYFIKVPWLKPRLIDFPVTGSDFFPTLLELARVPFSDKEQVEGISLIPAMNGEKLPGRNLYWHYPHYGNQGGQPSSMIRQGPYKLIYYWEENTSELYHVVNDPGEQQDLASAKPRLTSALENQLLAYLKSENALIPSIDTSYDTIKREQLQQYRRTDLLQELESRRISFLAPDFKPNNTWWDSQSIDKVINSEE